jgi:hypothetical protein
LFVIVFGGMVYEKSVDSTVVVPHHEAFALPSLSNNNAEAHPNIYQLAVDNKDWQLPQ